MKLALQLGFWDAKPTDRFIELAKRADDLGFDTVFTAEAYSSDVFVPLAAIATHTKKIRLGTSIMQISARSPACSAQTAVTLDHLSNGRVVLGLGVSGPQVVEGWHGMPFQKPIERTKEWLEIFNKVVAREDYVSFEGRQYQLPYKGPGSTGLGKPLKIIVHPLRKKIPLLLGAEGPKNVELAFSHFDGWIPMWVAPERLRDVFGDLIAKKKPGFEIVCNASLAIGDDWQAAAAPIKQRIGLYVGGMGAKDQNFHKSFMERIGFPEEAQRIQDLWLSGKQAEAVAAVTDEMVNAIALVGSKAQIRERLKAYKNSDVTTLIVGRADTFEETVKNMEFMANEVL